MIGSETSPYRRNQRLRRISNVFFTCWLYSLAVCIYLLGNTIAHPATLDLPLTHLRGVPQPTERELLWIAGAFGSLTFFCYFLVRQFIRPLPDRRVR